ncbi:MAG: hypothetical protein ACHREM_22205, partial [Polyangiales bacterium]
GKESTDDAGGAASSAELSGASNGLVVIPDSPFDVIYMPDFDEQYAIDIDGRYSDAELKFALANGWMLESVDEKVDNSAFKTFLLQQAGKTLDVLRSLGSMAAGLPTTGLQGQPSAGTNVLVRARTISYVVPGVYPVLKPKELTACQTSPCAGVVPFHTRSERFFEVVRVDSSSSAAANTALKEKAKTLLGSLSVDVNDVQIVDGNPTVTVQPKSGTPETKELKDKLTKALHNDTAFKTATVCWADESCH